MDWESIREYRDLLWLMLRRDFVSKYKQTLLGPLWFVLQPLATTFVFVVVFSHALGVETGNAPAVLFYLSGLLVWGYVSNSFSSIARCLTDNAELCKRVYFPRIFLPIAAALSSFVPFLLQLAVYLAFSLCYGVFPAPSSSWLFLPVVILEMFFLSLGLGLIFASLTVRLRDLHHVSGFILSLWMYASPIAYSIDKVPLQYRAFFLLNPVTFMVSTVRDCFLGTSDVNPQMMVWGLWITLSFLILGLLLFLKLEKNFIDTI